MAKLSDLINVNENKDHVTIQGVEIPIAFTMQTMEFVAEGYGKSFAQLEKDLNAMFKKKVVTMGNKELKLISALLYGMVRSGGTETTVEELIQSIPFNEVPQVANELMRVFNDKYFQPEDYAKLKDNGEKK